MRFKKLIKPWHVTLTADAKNILNLFLYYNLGTLIMYYADLWEKIRVFKLDFSCTIQVVIYYQKTKLSIL